MAVEREICQTEIVLMTQRIKVMTFC